MFTRQWSRGVLPLGCVTSRLLESDFFHNLYIFFTITSLYRWVCARKHNSSALSKPWYTHFVFSHRDEISEYDHDCLIFCSDTYNLGICYINRLCQIPIKFVCTVLQWKVCNVIFCFQWCIFYQQILLNSKTFIWIPEVIYDIHIYKKPFIKFELTIEPPLPPPKHKEINRLLLKSRLVKMAQS